MALKQDYHRLWFKSFRLHHTSGHRHDIQLKLKSDQALPAEVIAECEARDVDPFSLLTECNTDYFTKYPAGSEFLLDAKLTDRSGGTMFFYSYYRWQALEIIPSKG